MKHKPPYKVQKIPKNQLESEDGGGNWHQHVSKRHGSSTNLSKSCILGKKFHALKRYLDLLVFFLLYFLDDTFFKKYEYEQK